MRLTELARTGSFRLALLFLLLFTTMSVCLFGFLYTRTIQYTHENIDDWLSREASGLTLLVPSEYESGLARHAIANPTGTRPFAIFDAGRQRIAGSIETYPSDLRAFDAPIDTTIHIGGTTKFVRAMARQLPGGAIGVVSQDISDFRAFTAIFLEASLLGGFIALAIGLTAATMLGLGAVRRIDEVTLAIKRIVRGDLSGRLPSRGAGEVDRLARVVNGMLDDIERLMNEVKGVCDGIAHDLRTPLTRLLARLERSQRRALSAEEYAVEVEAAIAEVVEILGTFTALLRISELENSARKAGFVDVDLLQISKDVVEFYTPVAEDKGVSLVLRAAESPIPFSGDPSLLFEALGHLVDNALKFTPAGGSVCVIAMVAGGKPSLAVEDSGPGIPPEEREAVRRRFHRVKGTRGTPGNGLGLSLTAVVAELHGLRLEIGDAVSGCRVAIVAD